ncbi:hypothetical protein CR513_10504, partial [Mucuna pruriens]
MGHSCRGSTPHPTILRATIQQGDRWNPYPSKLQRDSGGTIRWNSGPSCTFISLLDANVHQWWQRSTQLQVFFGHLEGCSYAMDGYSTSQAFSDLANSFLSQFAANRLKKLEVVDLFDIKQARSESLKSYLTHFNNATVQVDDSDQKFFVKAFQKGLRVGPFSDALTLRKSSSMEEIRARAVKHVEVEEDQTDRLEAERAEHKDVKRSSHQKEDSKRQLQMRVRDFPQNFTPLTKKRTQILREICYTSMLEFPPR